MNKIEAVCCGLLALVTMIAYLVNRDSASLLQAIGFALVSVSTFFSVAAPARFSDKVTWAGLFRSPDNVWVIAVSVIGWLLVTLGFAISAFGR